MHKSNQEKGDHLVKCSLMPGRRNQKKAVVGAVRRRAVHRRQRRMAKGVNTDPDETREVQEKRIDYSKKKGDRHFTDDGRVAETTVDLVLQARAKMFENKVNGNEDAVVSVMIKLLPLEKIQKITRCFQERFVGQMEAPNSWKFVKFDFFRKPDAEPKGIRSYRAIALTSVMSKWYASCRIIFRLLCNFP